MCEKTIDNCDSESKNGFIEFSEFMRVVTGSDEAYQTLRRMIGESNSQC